MELTTLIIVKASDYVENDKSTELVGVKCARLAAMMRWGLPVPEWYCITVLAYDAFLRENSICVPSLLQAESHSIQHFRRQVCGAAFPDWIREEIAVAAQTLLGISTSGAVAVRSSASLEDSSDATFAGQFDTFLGIQSVERLLAQIKRCWISPWSSKALSYGSRQAQSVTDMRALAVIVQELVPADISGTMFTANPITYRDDQIVIEASWGLGELMVRGTVTPDHFLVDLDDRHRIGNLTRRIGSKSRYAKWNSDKQSIEEIITAPVLRNQLTLNDLQITELVDLGLTLQTSFGCPQDIEWAIDDDRIYLLQSRPITTLES